MKFGKIMSSLVVISADSLAATGVRAYVGSVMNKFNSCIFMAPALQVIKYILNVRGYASACARKLYPPLCIRYMIAAWWKLRES